MPRTALYDFADLIPVAVVGHRRRHPNPSQAGRIQWNDAFVSDFQLDRAFGATALGNVTIASDSAPV